MNRKIGRNDPCWCGSGLKYKKCHLNRVPSDSVNIQEADKELRKNFNRKVCLSPASMTSECSGGIVRSHTVPRSGSLKRIARDSHVYGFIPSIAKIQKSPDGKIWPELVGVNEASTFTGFCKFHDNSIFSEIENENFSGTQRQCFLLAYRALARSIYAKNAQISTHRYTTNLVNSPPLKKDKYTQLVNEAMSAGLAISSKDSDYYKDIYDNVLLSGNFSCVRACILELQSPPPIMTSSAVYPMKNFDGELLQNVGDLNTIPHLISCTSYFGGTSGIITFTWLPDSDNTCIQFINSLKTMHANDITSSLIRFLFSYSENLFIQPDWWDNLNEIKKKNLVHRLFVAASLDPRYMEETGNLTDDGIRYNDWPISNMYTIGY